MPDLDQVIEIDVMFLCPVCNREVVAARMCGCGTDVSLLQAIRARGGALLERAMAVEAAGHPAASLAYLEACAMLMVLPLAAQVKQVDLLMALGRLDKARIVLQHLQQVAPTHPELPRLMMLVDTRR